MIIEKNQILFWELSGTFGHIWEKQKGSELPDPFKKTKIKPYQ